MKKKKSVTRVKTRGQLLHPLQDFMQTRASVCVCRQLCPVNADQASSSGNINNWTKRRDRGTFQFTCPDPGDLTKNLPGNQQNSSLTTDPAPTQPSAASCLLVCSVAWAVVQSPSLTPGWHPGARLLSSSWASYLALSLALICKTAHPEATFWNSFFPSVNFFSLLLLLIYDPASLSKPL